MFLTRASLPHRPQEVKREQKAEHTLQAYFEGPEHGHEHSSSPCFQKAGCVKLLPVYTGLLSILGAYLASNDIFLKNQTS